MVDYILIWTIILYETKLLVQSSWSRTIRDIGVETDESYFRLQYRWLAFFHLAAMVSLRKVSGEFEHKLPSVCSKTLRDVRLMLDHNRIFLFKNFLILLGITLIEMCSSDSSHQQTFVVNSKWHWHKIRKSRIYQQSTHRCMMRTDSFDWCRSVAFFRKQFARENYNH